MVEQAHTTNLEKKLKFFGRWIVTPFYAIGSGTLTTVAVSSLSFIAGLALPYLIPILAVIFLAETIVSIYFFKDSVPETLSNLFVTNIFKNLSPIKRILLGIGLFSALGAGLSLGALTFTSGTVAVAAILGLASLSCPPVGMAIAGILALVGFIAITSLFIKWISNAIKNDIHKQIAAFFKTQFTRDRDKYLVQQILEVGFKFLFTSVFILLATVGTIATLGTMNKGLTTFLALIPNANLLAVKISGGIISYGLMGIARLPFVLHSLCSLTTKLGETVGKALFKAGQTLAIKLGIYHPPHMGDETNNPQEETHIDTKKVFGSIGKLIVIMAHSVSFGVLAKTGGGAVLSNIITDSKIPLPPGAIGPIGEYGSMVSAGTISACLGTFTLFKPKPSEENANNAGANNTTNPLLQEEQQSEVNQR
jgi:hypothetical protein